MTRLELLSRIHEISKHILNLSIYTCSTSLTRDEIVILYRTLLFMAEEARRDKDNPNPDMGQIAWEFVKNQLESQV